MVVSLKVPRAVNCVLLPMAMEAAAGEMARDCRVAEVTVSGAGWLIIPPSVAVICVVPGATPVAIPRTESMVAKRLFEEIHVACVVIFFELPSLYFPVATNCSFVPVAMVELTGVTVIERRVAAEVTVSEALLLTIGFVPVCVVAREMGELVAATN